jgi:3-deoxy-D-manno-octulosonate 8-phosphate phosphatase (KDO 8-P phosphatase)
MPGMKNILFIKSKENKIRKRDKAMDLPQVVDIFKSMGGTFCTPASGLKEKAESIHGFIFDWDGVFHSGQKGESNSGVFSETDSMGINMLRYGYWRRHQRLPFIAIISGEQDKTAVKFAGREHFDGVYMGIKDKKNALGHACAAANVTAQQMVCVFDDIIDLSIAKSSGLKIQIKRTASPMFTEYTKGNGLCDYITAHTANENAVRECCELLLALWGNYFETIASRAAFDADYQAYWKARNENNTSFYTWENDKISASGGQGGSFRENRPPGPPAKAFD